MDKAFTNEVRTFFLVNKESEQLASQAFEIIEPHLPSILNDFYDHLLTNDTLKGILGSSSRSIDKLKDAQTAYWKTLFTSSTEDSYAEKVNTVGLIHAHIGLYPRFYIGGYSLITERILNILINELKPTQKCGLFSRKKAGKDQTKEIIDAVIKTIFMDMGLAIAIYQQKMDESSTKVLSTTEKFTSEVMSRIEESASATMELGASSEEIAKETQQNSELLGGMNSAISEVQEKVTSLADMTRDINSILDLIRDVSEQTNLLALNASIEAARAGEAGRGFAVVADEVKKLAGSTEDSVAKIVTSIDEILKTSNEATSAVEILVSGTEKIMERSTSIATSVDEQSEATAQISNNFISLKSHVESVGNEILDALKK